MNEPVGLTVSEFYKYLVELNYYHFGDSITQNAKELLKSEKLTNFFTKGFWRKTYNSTDVLNIRKNNISDIAMILTGRIIALNEELWEELGEIILSDGIKYTPTCVITFTDTEPLTPLIENTNISKLLKSFRVKVNVYKTFDEEYIIKSGELQKMVEYAIKEQLLDVIDQMKEEETYVSPVDLSGILPPSMKQV